MRGKNLQFCPFIGHSCPFFGYLSRMPLFSRISPDCNAAMAKILRQTCGVIPTRISLIAYQKISVLNTLPVRNRRKVLILFPFRTWHYFQVVNEK